MTVQTDPLIRKLMAKLRDPDPITRRNAAGALRLQGAKAAAALPAIAQLLDDEDIRVRREAARAVQHLRLPAA
ncbi:MAG: hypothetical protein GX594_15225 [Pirellulaceae bacterium]|nr:hypothetical protein [Pirellulaceae bacterium]